MLRALRAEVESLEGNIVKVIYRNPDGYTVLSMQVAERLLPVTVVGSLVDVHEGEQLRVQGRWVQHPRFGEQFRADQHDAQVPGSEEGLLRYLSSGAIAGIGPALAERLVSSFGLQLFDMAERDPMLLMQVPGIGKRRARTIARGLVEQRAVREIMVFLRGLEIGPGTATRIYRVWGDETIQRLREDPFALVEDVEGIGFATADAIAGRLGVEHNSASRLRAGLIHLTHEARDAGHTVVLCDELLERAEAFLQSDRVLLEQVLDDLTATGKLLDRSDGAGDSVVGSRSLVLAEESIAAALGRLMSQSRDTISAKAVAKHVEAVCGAELTREQRDAVALGLSSAVTIITGGPGTGKTTVLRALVEALERRGERPVLCAPTGRAAKRLAEATESPASTVHRLLGFGGQTFTFHRGNPLESGTVIVDEASMLDVILTRQLLDALPIDARLVLVGDVDQLPSVGPGHVLADLIASRRIPAVWLTEVFRQAASSRIVRNAHHIREGRRPEPSAAGSHEHGDFHVVVAEDVQRAQRLLLEICCERIPTAYGLDPVKEVQVLSPMHRGPLGTTALNGLLQQRLNPEGPALERRGEWLRVGDKVMQTRNDYDREVFNGDIGAVVAVDEEEGMLTVEIGGTRVVYEGEQLGQLVLAFCVSVHKSQGSEYPAVVIPLTMQHRLLLQRNLVYTAVTRARRLVVLVGSQRALDLAISQVDPVRRRTLLGTLLSAGCDRICS